MAVNTTEHKQDGEDETESVVSIWINQVLGMVVCIICNLLVIVGIQKNSPNLLIPWLAVYLIGVFSLIVGGLLVLITQLTITFITYAPFIPIITGLVFLVLWWQVKNVFCSIRINK